MVEEAIYFGQKPQARYQEKRSLELLAQNNDQMQMQLIQKDRALERARQEVCNLKAGFYGSDWKLRQDLQKNQLWLFDGKNQEVLAEAIIQQVVAYVLQTEKLQFAFRVAFHLASGTDVMIFFNHKDFELSSAMIRKLEMNRIYLATKRSDRLKTRLLARFIMDHISETIVLPECAGWTDHLYYFCDSALSRKLKGIGFSAPYLERCFSESVFEPETAKLAVDSLFSILGRENAMLLLTITAGSLLCTPLKERGYWPGVLFTLEGDGSTVAIIRKWMQPWKQEFYSPLKNKRYITEAICGSQDEVLFLLDEGTRYSLNLSPFLSMLGDVGELEVNSRITQLKSVPVLITRRSSVWKKNGLSLLNLPFTQGSSSWVQVDRKQVSDFWHSFCDFLNGTYSIIDEELKKTDIYPYVGKRYRQVYHWLIKSYAVLAHFLEMLMGHNKILSEDAFSRFVGTWLQGVEQQSEMDIGDYFISCLQNEKNMGQIVFVGLGVFESDVVTRLIFRVDFEWVYVPADVFAFLVQKFLPGCSEKEVYVSLTESEYAKPGEGSHVFPKAPLRASRNGIRERMASIRRSLLLSEAEFLLEV